MHATRLFKVTQCVWKIVMSHMSSSLGCRVYLTTIFKIMSTTTAEFVKTYFDLSVLIFAVNKHYYYKALVHLMTNEILNNMPSQALQQVFLHRSSGLKLAIKMLVWIDNLRETLQLGTQGINLVAYGADCSAEGSGSLWAQLLSLQVKFAALIQSIVVNVELSQTIN